MLAWRLKSQLQEQNLPTQVAESPRFFLVREGGLCSCSCGFNRQKLLKYPHKMQNSVTSPKARRDRGRILTEMGWQKLLSAVNTRFPEGYIVQDLSDLADPAFYPKSRCSVSIDTVSKILKRSEGVDKKGIESLFMAFGLKLETGDHASSKDLGLNATGDIIKNQEIVATPATLNSNFVGREGAFAELHTKIRQGAKVIVIQAPGGVGKTTLAQEFLSSQKFEVVLDLPMAKEEANITPVESVVEEWLKRDFNEEPGRDFGVMLGRLKRQLQTKRVGVLIDNLEPALDGQGKFIESHRRYVELLRVLADASVKSLTLITSREPLAEGLSISSYSLPSLGEEAWADFFRSRGLEVEATILKEIHRAYGGNALAMTILCDPIEREGGMGAYWQEHKIEAGLLVELAVENLVKEQFNRLEKISPEAYRLLCRLGCYRYQDVPTVPTDGLLCLLWDVSEVRCRQVIKFLQSWSLVECSKGEFWLHPIIREQAIIRLRESLDWEQSNKKAAKFWTKSVAMVKTVGDALRALEASLHYLSIENFDEACKILVLSRDSAIDESLGQAFYRFCLFEKITSIVKYISNNIDITDKLYGSQLYNIVGAMYWLKGDISKALNYYVTAKELAIKFKAERFHRLSLLNIALCWLDLGETEKSLDVFNEYEKLGKQHKDAGLDIDFISHKIQVWYCLALVNSILGFKKEAFYLAEKASNEIDRVQLKSPWSRGYGLLFLGLVYKNLENLGKSRELYHRTLTYSDEIHYTQVKAKSLTGLAELHRLQSEFETAISHHEESIELLEKIGAKCDLAEAYYQLALTYQAMGEPDQSQEYFTKAIQLYEEMEAPKQVEKVHRAIENKL